MTPKLRSRIRREILPEASPGMAVHVAFLRKRNGAWAADHRRRTGRTRSRIPPLSRRRRHCGGAQFQRLPDRQLRIPNGAWHGPPAVRRPPGVFPGSPAADAASHRGDSAAVAVSVRLQPGRLRYQPGARQRQPGPVRYSRHCGDLHTGVPWRWRTRRLDHAADCGRQCLYRIGLRDGPEFPGICACDLQLQRGGRRGPGGKSEPRRSGVRGDAGIGDAAAQHGDGTVPVSVAGQPERPRCGPIPRQH